MEACIPLIIVGRNYTGNVIFILPLAIRNQFGCRVLEWLTSNHGNYSSGLFAQNAPAYLPEQDGEKLLASLLAELPDIDLVSLDSQPVEIAGMMNPLAQLPGVAATSAGYAMTINENWKSHYRSRFSSNYRRGLRRHERRLAELGAFEFKRVLDATERLEAVDFIFEHKRKWLAKRGITDFLAREDSRAFYRELACMPAVSTGMATCIYRLNAGGETLAASLDLTFQNRFYGLLSATTSGPLQRHGPGKLLMKYTVRELADERISVIDFGAGEDEHKLRWCTQRRERYHSIVPISTRGRLYGEALKATSLAKQQIKQSPGLWRLATHVRRLKSSPASSLS